MPGRNGRRKSTVVDCGAKLVRDLGKPRPGSQREPVDMAAGVQVRDQVAQLNLSTGVAPLGEDVVHPQRRGLSGKPRGR